MTGRTHDLAAFTALSFVVLSQPLEQYSLGTMLVAFSANMVGGLVPDLDQASTNFWDTFRGGHIIGKLIAPIIEHRHISHSIIGVILAGVIMQILLTLTSSFLLVDQTAVWWAFMIGFLSHLAMDMLTTEGVPLLFPIRWKFGFPPIRALRIKTGKFMEKAFIFPGLILINGYMFYVNYQKILDLLRHYIK